MQAGVLQTRQASHLPPSSSGRGTGHARCCGLEGRQPGNRLWRQRRRRRAVAAAAPEAGNVGAPVSPVAAAAPAAEQSDQQQEGVVTVEEVQEIASTRGLDIAVSWLGPAYRVSCRDAASRRLLGATSGFVLPPARLMLCDSLQVFVRGLGGEEGVRARGGGVRGLGLLLGGATFAAGASAGCTKAEILAIDDDDVWHERLVRYYSHFGFVPVHRVTGRLADLPHMLVWGGAGTRMDADIPAMLARWTPAIRARRRPAAETT